MAEHDTIVAAQGLTRSPSSVKATFGHSTAQLSAVVLSAVVLSAVVLSATQPSVTRSAGWARRYVSTSIGTADA